MVHNMNKEDFFNSLSWSCPKKEPIDWSRPFAARVVYEGKQGSPPFSLLEIYGDINLENGVCSCCTNFATIESYAYLWESN